MNSPVIVVGKNQNTLQEINMEYVRDNHIDVVRRLSGGGAVYHDLGNLNFTIITENNAPKVFDFQSFSQPVIHVLKDLGISASFSGRNDIQIDGQKFCGNAQYRNKGRVLHHGAMFFDVDLMVLSKALKVSEDKMASKGVASVYDVDTKGLIRPRFRLLNLSPQHVRQHVTRADDAEAPRIGDGGG